MLYELIICAVQTVVMIAAILIFREDFPSQGTMFPAVVEFYISCFLCMYASDVLGIAVSSIVKTENAAMAVMPFVLIIQLVLAGIIFELDGSVEKVSNFTVSKWGVQAMCATSDINNMPDAFTILQRDREIEQLKEAGMKPSENEKEDIYDKYMDEQKDDDSRTDKSFNHKSSNVLKGWGYLVLYTIVYGVISVLALEVVDKDKR
jgi:ABC-type transport system involved in multi-copper enzyme maturation permease subunit